MTRTAAQNGGKQKWKNVPIVKEQLSAITAMEQEEQTTILILQIPTFFKMEQVLLNALSAAAQENAQLVVEQVMSLHKYKTFEA